jgi:hypothetical protein
MDAPQIPDNTLFERIKTPLLFITFLLVMTVLIVLVLIQIYGGSLQTTESGGKVNVNYIQDIQTSFIIIGFIFSILVISFLLLPNFKDIKIFIGKFLNILILILYIIGLIIFFRDMPSNIISFYSFIILPVVLLIGFYLFYISLKNNAGAQSFNVNTERIKYTLLYFCFIVFVLLLYTADPGKYISTYFGPSLVITILLAIFGFLYLITLMSIPSLSSVSSNPLIDQGFFKGVTTIGLCSGVLFILFLIVVIIGIIVFPGGFLKDMTPTKIAIVSGIIIQLIIIFVLWIIFFGVSIYKNIPRDQAGNIQQTISNYTSIGKQVFLILFGLIFTGVLIGWIATITDSLYSKSGIIAFILNILIILVILMFIFKMITGGTYYQKSPSYRLFINVLFYIPCIFTNLFDKLNISLGFTPSIGNVKMPRIGENANSIVQSIKSTPKSYYILLLCIIIAYVYYFFLGPQLTKNIAKQGGTILVNNPVYLNIENTIGMYDQLNNTEVDQHDYRYAFSFWLYLDSSNPNIVDKYTSILNYGGNPNILYNPTENTLIITMMNIDSEYNKKELDEYGNIIIFKLPNVLLQKWNNIIFNYNGGTIDIFYNGKLLKSILQILPYVSKDVLTVGTQDGINGGICNVTYFDTDITASQIYYLYNIVKNKDPPVAITSKESIVKNVAKGVGVKNPNSQIVTIPINIDIMTLAKTVDTVQDDIPIINKNKINTDYISPKWYFTANNDNYNGI